MTMTRTCGALGCKNHAVAQILTDDGSYVVCADHIREDATEVTFFDDE